MLRNLRTFYNGVLFIDCTVTVFLYTVTDSGAKEYNTCAKSTDLVLYSEACGIKCTVTLLSRNLEGAVASVPKRTASEQYSAIYRFYSNCSVYFSYCQ